MMICLYGNAVLDNTLHIPTVNDAGHRLIDQTKM